MEEAKKALTAEVVAVKTRWASEIKLQKAPKDAPGAPLPLCVARTISRPDAASAFDVDELTIKMWIDGLELGAPKPAPAAVDISDEGSSAAPAASAPPSDGLPVRVELADGNVPGVLQQKIAAKVRDRWAAELRARGASNSWFLEKLLAWAEGAFAELLQLEPSLVETYEGCDDEGRTIRRYAIAEPPPPPPPAPEGGSDDDEDDSDEDYSSSDDDEADGADAVEAKLKKMGLDPEKERQMRIKMKAEEEAARLYKEQRRKEAEEMRQRGEEAPKRHGKKEQEEARKQKEAKKGARLRKAGPKHNKFDAEAAGAKKNKKNGLMH